MRIAWIKSCETLQEIRATTCLHTIIKRGWVLCRSSALKQMSPLHGELPSEIPHTVILMFGFNIISGENEYLSKTRRLSTWQRDVSALFFFF